MPPRNELKPGSPAGLLALHALTRHDLALRQAMGSIGRLTPFIDHTVLHAAVVSTNPAANPAHVSVLTALVDVTGGSLSLCHVALHAADAIRLEAAFFAGPTVPEVTNVEAWLDEAQRRFARKTAESDRVVIGRAASLLMALEGSFGDTADAWPAEARRRLRARAALLLGRILIRSSLVAWTGKLQDALEFLLLARAVDAEGARAGEPEAVAMDVETRIGECIVHRRRGDWQRALAVLDAVPEDHRRLVAEAWPLLSGRFWHARASALSTRFDETADRSTLDEEIACHERAVEGYCAHLKREPGSEAARDELYCMKINLGRMKLERGRLPEALQAAHDVLHATRLGNREAALAFELRARIHLELARRAPTSSAAAASLAEAERDALQAATRARDANDSRELVRGLAVQYDVAHERGDRAAKRAFAAELRALVARHGYFDVRYEHILGRSRTGTEPPAGWHGPAWRAMTLVLGLTGAAFCLFGGTAQAATQRPTEGDPCPKSIVRPTEGDPCPKTIFDPTEGDPCKRLA